jgi:hypothetical protein
MIRRLLMVSLLAAASLASTNVWAQLRSPLISEITARRYGLTRSWFGQVELDRTRDRVESLTIHERILFAQTKRGKIHAFDAETGKTLWVQQVGGPLHPTSEVGVNNQFVAAINGSTLYVLERDTGKYKWSRRVVGAPGAGPGLSKRYVFVPTTNGILEAYDLEEPRKPAWLYNSGGRALVQPMVTTSSVSWPTDRGLFYVAGAENLSIRYRTEARDDIVAQAAHIPPYFYVGSLDGHLYKVHERSGSIAWRFTSGEPVAERPLAVNGRIYTTALHGGLYCILGDERVARDAAFAEIKAAVDRGEIPKDKVPEPEPLPVDEGSEIWWSPGIVRLLAVTPTRVYGIDRSGRMRICRADTGTPITMMDVSQISLSVVNNVSDRIYLGTEFGFVQCLHEPQLKDPLNYVIKEAGEEEDKPAIAANKGEDLFGGGAAAGGEAAGGADPFGGGNAAGGADPFGGAGGADPFGGGDAGGGADPFGGGDAGGGADPFGGGDAGGGADPFGGGDAGGGADPFGGGDAGGGDAGGGADPFGGDPFN